MSVRLREVAMANLDVVSRLDLGPAYGQRRVRRHEHVPPGNQGFRCLGGLDS